LIAGSLLVIVILGMNIAEFPKFLRGRVRSVVFSLTPCAGFLLGESVLEC